MGIKKTTDEQDKEIIKLYLSGIKPKILYKQFNISNSTFIKILKDNNVKPNQAKRFTEEEKLSIAEAYKNGKSAKTVGEEFNIAESSVLTICKKLNIQIRKSSERVLDQFLINEEKEDIIKLYQAGISPKEIGKKYDMPNNSVTRLLKKLGIDRNQRKNKIKKSKILNNVTNKIINNSIPENYGTTAIVSFNNIPLSKNYILSLSDEDKLKAADAVFNYFRTYGFPYPRHTDFVLKNDWYSLLETDTKDLLQNNIINSFNKINAGNKIWKNFSLHYYNATDGKKLSMLDAFNSDKILMKAIRNRLGITYKETFLINGNVIKQAFKAAHLSSQISVFNTTIAKLVYDKYTNLNDTVYDFSMGFGQRLLGSMACKNNLTYIGVDPWNKTVPSLKKIAKFINKYDKCQLYRIGAEKFCPDDLHNTIDLAFSSPPYYDIEIYDKHKSQANFNKTYDQFINEWWLKVTQNIYKLLKIGGRLALNMKQNILDDMMPIILNNGFKLIETLYIRSSRKHMGNGENYVNEPIAIFEKI